MNKIFHTLFGKGLILLSLGFLLTACVDNSFNFNDDMDMTMGLGSKGLQMKIGSTERIYLRDLLKVEEETMLDTTTAHLFYLKKSNSSDVQFTLPSVNAVLNDIVIATSVSKELSSAVTLSPGTVVADDVDASSNDEDFDLKLENVDVSVARVKEISLGGSGSDFALNFQVLRNGTPISGLAVTAVKDFKIILPDGVELADGTRGTYNIGNVSGGNAPVRLDHIKVSKLHFADEGLGKTVSEEGGVRSLSLDGTVRIEGSVTVKALTSVDMAAGDVISANLIISNAGMNVSRMSGVFNPAINPNVEPINIDEDLPSFLRDNDVLIDAANPTLKLTADLSAIPANILLSANLVARLASGLGTTVGVPASGEAGLDGSANNVSYFYASGATPFTSNGIVETNAKLYKVPNLTQLIRKIPRQVEVDLGGGKMHLDQSELVSTNVPASYSLNLTYDIAVPFQFNGDLSIVYSDSVLDMHDDLKKYEADSVYVSAIIKNTIPLALSADIELQDVSGRPIQGAVVQSANVAANSTESVRIKVSLANSADLKLVDRMMFRVKADAVGGSGNLCSDQYLEVNDITLELAGQVTGNFN